MTTQITPDVETLRQEIQKKYTEVATSPERTFHFHHGRPLAQLLGYPMDRVDAMPTAAVESFAGVGNPFSVGSIPEGATVMDVGSGGGFDCFIAGQATGRNGKVIGVDMTDAMLARSRAAAKEMGLDQVEFRHGVAEQLPVDDASVDTDLQRGNQPVPRQTPGISRNISRVEARRTPLLGRHSGTQTGARRGQS